MNALVLREDADGIATPTLNRPEQHNALNPELLEALDVHVRAIGAATAEVGEVDRLDLGCERAQAAQDLDGGGVVDASHGGLGSSAGFDRQKA